MQGHDQPDAPPVPGPVGICADTFDHWRALARDGEAVLGIPVRDQIDLLTLPRSVRGNFFLIEHQKGRYLVRLASATLVDNMGTETRGKYLDELMRPEIYPARRALFDLCVQQGCAIYYGATLAAPTRDHIAFRRILLPLRSTPRAEIDLVCGAMEFVSSQELANGSPISVSSASSEAINDNGLFFRRSFQSGRWLDWTPALEGLPVAPTSR